MKKQVISEIQEKSMKEFVSLLNNIHSNRKQKITEMMNTIGSRYFSAPASSNKDHHSPFTGGLAYHSINVTNTLIKLVNLFMNDDPDINIKNIIESATIVGLFHDLGKIGSVNVLGKNDQNDEPYYIPEKSDWHIEKLGRFFTYNVNLQDSLTVPQRSLRTLQCFDIDLTNSEYISILYHDSLYVEANRHSSHMNSKDKLMRLTHMADSYTTFVYGI